MTCPFCGKEMLSGILTFDSRAQMRYVPADANMSFLDRLLLPLGNEGVLTAAEYSFWKGGRLKSDYCPDCKKMILETDLEK